MVKLNFKNSLAEETTTVILARDEGITTKVRVELLKMISRSKNWESLITSGL